MGKEKMKGQKGLGQKHLHSRISYLYQTAAYLASTDHGSKPVVQAIVEEMERDEDHTYPEGAQRLVHKIMPESEDDSRKEDTQDEKAPGSASGQQSALSRLFINHLKAVSLKSQIRLTPEMKHSICNRCDILLVPGSTSINSLENKSRGGKKPWADVFVVTCKSCGTAKRFPVGAKRQFRRPDRVRQGEKEKTAA